MSDVFTTLHQGPEGAPGAVGEPLWLGGGWWNGDTFARQPMSAGGAFGANFEDAFYVQRAGAREERLRSELYDRHTDIERRLGRQIPRSRFMIDGFTSTDALGEDHDFMDPDGSRAFVEAAQPGRARFDGLDDDGYERQIEELRAKFPDKMKGVPTRADLDARRDRELRGISQRAAEGGQDHPVAGFLGGAAGSFVDPINLIGTAYTGGLGAGRPILMRILMQGAANAGIEAIQEPFKALDSRFGGPEWTAGQALTNIAGAGVAGGLFEAGGAAAKWAFKGGLKRLAPGAHDFIFADPAARGALNALETAARDDAVIGDRDGGAAHEALAALDRPGPPPAVAPDRELPQLFEAGETTVDYRGRPIHAASFDATKIETAPETFQYKADGDAHGVTARLRGVEAWDPTASGKVLIWEDPSGRLFMADGHQRLGLAKRLEGKGFDARLDGYLFRAAEGWTARDVRVVAALKNIREGSGTILDAAKVFRDAPEAVRDKTLPVTGDFMAQARGLARLSREAFGAVINKVIPERYGAEIGAIAGDRPDLHDNIVRLLKEAEPGNVDEARALVIEALQDDWIRTEGTTGDLFGYDPSVSAMIGRAKVAAAIQAELRKDARLYSTLIRNADAIEAGGNALARDANEAKLAIDRAALDVVSKMALRSGPLGEAMAEAAARVVRGEGAAKAARGILARVRNMIEAGEHLELLRRDLLTPEPPDASALDQAKIFDDPTGKGVEAQVKPKPEEAELELSPDEEQSGLFDDIPMVGAEAQAHERLAPCAPGV